MTKNVTMYTMEVHHSQDGILDIFQTDNLQYFYKLCSGLIRKTNKKPSASDYTFQISNRSKYDHETAPQPEVIECEWCGVERPHYITTGMSREKICKACADECDELGYDTNEL